MLSTNLMKLLALLPGNDAEIKAGSGSGTGSRPCVNLALFPPESLDKLLPVERSWSPRGSEHLAELWITKEAVRRTT